MNLVTVASPEFFYEAMQLIKSFKKFYSDSKIILCYFGGDLNADIPFSEDIHLIEVPRLCEHAHNPRLYFYKTYALKAAMSFNEQFLYLDSRHKLIKKPIDIENTLKEKDRFFVQYPHDDIYKLKVCTTSKCFKELECDSDVFKESYCYWAAIQAYNPTEFNKMFIEEMLCHMMNPDIAGPSNYLQYPEPHNQICKYHRNDQSLLSIMIAKYNIHQFYSHYVSSKYGDVHTLMDLGCNDPHPMSDLVIIGRNTYNSTQNEETCNDMNENLPQKDGKYFKAINNQDNANIYSSETQLKIGSSIIKNNKLKVSAIVSTYNSEKFIEGCLQDLVDQTLYKNGLLEIVIIDSGSQQNEEEIVKKFQTKYPNIVYQKTPEREGIYSAWNRGIKLAKGKYITNANTDDRHKLDGLEIMSNCLDEDQNIGVVYSNQFVTNHENQTYNNHIRTGSFDWPDFDRIQLVHCAICGPQPMWRKEIHDVYGYFDESLIVAGDYEMWLRISDKVGFHHINEYLGLYLLADLSIEHRNNKEMESETNHLRASYAQKVGLKYLDYHKYKPTFLNLINSSIALVSVIIPTFNRRDQLKNAIQSVLNQTYQNFEIIVVNDAGEDSSDVVNEFNDQRIKYVNQDINKGAAASRNTGLKNATGHFIAYLDDDDIYYPNHLQILTDFAENNPKIKVFYTDANEHKVKINGNSFETVSKSVFYSIDFSREQLLYMNISPTLCFFHSHDIVDSYGYFDENLKTHEDWEYWLRLAMENDFIHIKQTTCEYRKIEGKSGLTNDNILDFQSTRKIIYERYPVPSNSLIHLFRNREIQINEKSIGSSSLNQTNIEKGKYQKKDFIDEYSVKISFVVPLYNAIEYTRQMLKSFVETVDRIDFEIIFVDNNSTDGTKQLLMELETKEFFKRRTYNIYNDENLNFAGACNQGASSAHGEYLIFLNSDLILTKGWLEPFINVANSDSEIGVIGNKHIFPDTGLLHHCFIAFSENLTSYHYLRNINPDCIRVNYSRECQVVTGACFLVKTKIFNQLGGFDNNFINGFEDTDFCLRVKESGYKVYYTHKSTIYHYGQKSPGRMNNEDRNLKYFNGKWQGKIKPDSINHSVLDAEFIYKHNPENFDSKINIAVFSDSIKQTDSLDISKASDTFNTVFNSEKTNIIHFVPDIPNYNYEDNELQFAVWSNNQQNFSSILAIIRNLKISYIVIDFDDLSKGYMFFDILKELRSEGIKMITIFNTITDHKSFFASDLFGISDLIYCRLFTPGFALKEYNKEIYNHTQIPFLMSPKVESYDYKKLAKNELKLSGDLDYSFLISDFNDYYLITDFIQQFIFNSSANEVLIFFKAIELNNFSNQTFERIQSFIHQNNLSSKVLFSNEIISPSLYPIVCLAFDRLFIVMNNYLLNMYNLISNMIWNRKPVIINTIHDFSSMNELLIISKTPKDCFKHLKNFKNVNFNAIEHEENNQSLLIISKTMKDLIREDNQIFNILPEDLNDKLNGKIGNKFESRKKAEEIAANYKEAINPILSRFIEKAEGRDIIFNKLYHEYFRYELIDNSIEYDYELMKNFLVAFFIESNLENYYFLYGGIGDLLLGISSFYDKYNGETIICIPNSIGTAKAFLQFFPKFNIIYFLPRLDDWIVEPNIRLIFVNYPKCIGRGVTPSVQYDLEWVKGLNIFEKYGVTEHPKWVNEYKVEKITNPQVILAPKGSVFGMPDGKQNIIPPENWKDLILLLKNQGITPIIIGIPDEASIYPSVEGCFDKRSLSFKGQMELLGSADLVIAADSWHKTFSALAGVSTIVFRSITNGFAKKIEDVSENVFLHPWKDITVVNNYKEFLEVFGYLDVLKKSSLKPNEIKLASLKDIHVDTSMAKSNAGLTSFSHVFWETDYSRLTNVLIIPTTAIGDNLMLTALVYDMKSQFDNLQIFILRNQVSVQIFRDHPSISGFVNSGNELQFDRVIDYYNIIAKMPEYYNGIHFMDIIGNIAGINFRKRDIVYQVDLQEMQWAKNELKDFKNFEVVGIQLFTNKDIKRSYPHGTHLLRALRLKNPNLRFVIFGGEVPFGIDISNVYDATQIKDIGYSIALASQCNKFISIDSMLFHIGHNLFQKPTLAILGLTNPDLIGNNSVGFSTVRNESLNCLCCYWCKECQIECMKDLLPETISEAYFNLDNYIVAESSRISERIVIQNGDDFRQIIYNYFLKSKKARIPGIYDQDGILPDYVKDWNGIVVSGPKWNEIEEDSFDNEFYLGSILGDGKDTKFDVYSESPENEMPLNDEKIFLNLGCGMDIIQGFVNIDLFVENTNVYKIDAKLLPYQDYSVDRIVANNLLECFSQKEIPAILTEWARVLKTKAELIIQVPSFRLINQAYQNGEINLNTLSHLIFGEDKQRQAIFDENYLKKQIEKAGLNIVESEEIIDASSHSYNIRFKTIKPENALQLSEAQTLQLGLDFGEKPIYENLPPKIDNEHTPRLNVVWEGSQFLYHSLALINREQCSNLLDTGLIELTIVPYEDDKFSPIGNPKYQRLAKNDIRVKEKSDEKTSKLPYLWIRHQWPPKSQEPIGAKWVIMQPWEYSTLPKAFVEIFRQADEIWTPSTFSRQCFINSGLDFDKVQVVPNGIDPVLFTPEGEKFKLKTNKKFKLLFVGGTIYRKGIDVLLQAYVSTFRRQDDVCLVIKDMGGDSFYKGQTFKEQIEKINVTDEAPEVIYLDQNLTEAEIVSLYRSCDVFVSPYRGEGFSLPTLEAMACGLPVIVTRGGSTDDFVDEESGWFVSATKRSIGSTMDGQALTGEAFVLEPDMQELTDILKNIYDRPSEVFSKGLNAMLKARTQWTWKKSTIQLLARIDALYDTNLSAEAEPRLTDPMDSYILLSKANQEFLNQNLDKALEDLIALLEGNSLSGKYELHALNLLAYIYFIKGLNDQAIECIEAALQIEENLDSKYLDAMVLSSEDNGNEALDVLTAMFDSWNDIKYQTTLGITLDLLFCETANIFLAQNDTEGALKLFTEALKYNSSNAEACFGSAKCFLSIDAIDEAKKMLECALNLNPDFTEARNLLESLM